MRATLSISIAGLALACAASAVRAEDAEILQTPDPATVLNIAKGFGSARMDKDDNGDPMIFGRVEGVKYLIYFYGCEDHENCKSLQFSTGYTDPLTADQANAWNAKYRWVKAYSGDGSNFKMDVSFAGGITRANLEEQFSNWNAMAGNIRDFVDGR
ncbi:MAG: YbjN domain-containing protein [Mesorhizobium sp.]|uniref:YbjN domain-containing protein n=1 Tax=Mesorhizobium sp. TaxID=1871066 RepID=UPI000FEA2690|nr:YbjN domain-containing protein [Mesorhizobium sp.]RWL82672.1 MAG: YbjN domain-containing protein [Mesorhizobium sp.]RWL90151.1 MAG: YbjN domain-containing protein [Mesorhizobium sp.]RWL98603.1 MAG: YbjN domain-containing protein [Mesorhizobium sp.]